MSTLKQDLETLKVPAKYKKATRAGVTAALAVLVYSLTDGHIDGGEVGAIISALLFPFGVTFKTTNKD